MYSKTDFRFPDSPIHWFPDSPAISRFPGSPILRFPVICQEICWVTHCYLNTTSCLSEKRRSALALVLVLLTSMFCHRIWQSYLALSIHSKSQIAIILIFSFRGTSPEAIIDRVTVSCNCVDSWTTTLHIIILWVGGLFEYYIFESNRRLKRPLESKRWEFTVI